MNDQTAPMGSMERDPAIAAEVAQQLDAILRGVVDVVTRDELERRLAKSLTTKTPLRVKLGVDPTSALLHLGFTVPLRKLRTFQDLGHQAVLVIGDVTARVGDPTGKSKMRPRLDAGEVLENARGYLEQAGRVLNLETLEIRYNSEWLAQMAFEEMVSLLAQTTVAKLLEREDFKERYREGTPIYLHEFLYPLLQGQDSVALRSDIELGGTDQLWNLLMGRDLQERAGMAPQICLTTPLLVGLDGAKKMSKSHGNTIGIAEAPEEMVKKVMRIDDGQIRPWLTLLTELPVHEIDALLAPGNNPRDAKLKLGALIAGSFHGAAAGEEAAAAWVREVAQRELPTDLPAVSIAGLADPEAVPIVDLLLLAEFAASKSEARRLISGGAVTLAEQKIEEIDARVSARDGMILRVGKKKVARLSK